MNKVNKILYDYIIKKHPSNEFEEVENLKKILLCERAVSTIENFRTIIKLMDNSGLSEEQQGKIYLTILKENYQIICDPLTMFNTEQLKTKLEPLGVNHIKFDCQGNFTSILADNANVEITKIVLQKSIQEYADELEETKHNYEKLFQLFANPSTEISSLLEVLNAFKFPKRVNKALLCLYASKIPHKKDDSTPIIKQEVLSVDTIAKPSKRELKAKLKEYYDEDNLSNLFNYRHYDKLIFLLQQLNYPEKHIEYIMANIARSHAENFYYYQYVYQKFCDLYPNSHLIKEVNEIICNMFIVNDEDYVFYKEYLLEILTKMAGDIQYSYSFDIKKVYKRQG